MTALDDNTNKKQKLEGGFSRSVRPCSKAMAVNGEDELDEEPGEVIESAPPQKVGEERQLTHSGLRKKILREGLGFETPEFNDEVTATVRCVGTSVDGTKLDSTRDRDQPLTFTLGQGLIALEAAELDHGVTTMKKGEVALFTLPADLSVSPNPNPVTQFEVELISWNTVVDVCKDGGILKKIMEKGTESAPPQYLDEVIVNYQVALVDGTVVAETPEGGVKFYVKDGHLFTGLPIAIMTMTRGEKAKLIVQPPYALGEKRRKKAKSGLHLIPPNSVLYVNIELVSFIPVISVTHGTMLLKKILKEGQSVGTADKGSKVAVRYTAMLEDGTVFEKRGIDETSPMEFTTNESQVIAGLDLAVATMKKGERAEISIHPDFAYGNVEVIRDFAVVPPGSNVVYDIEMVDFIQNSEIGQIKKEIAAARKESRHLSKTVERLMQDIGRIIPPDVST
ncbi:hypothetical protein RIF29_05908 [Crotalaria pallida]|uniref:peptidylprolyl isomerase n=1 Tax=Crotalaria pallida TaxID=3830 RepID=A0AAN9PAX9_CROPI